MTSTELAEEYERRSLMRNGGAYAIATALLRLADEQGRIAFWLKYLGNGDAATPMGAIEGFGAHIGEKLDAVAEALRGIGQ